MKMYNEETIFNLYISLIYICYVWCLYISESVPHTLNACSHHTCSSHSGMRCSITEIWIYPSNPKWISHRNCCGVLRLAEAGNWDGIDEWLHRCTDRGIEKIKIQKMQSQLFQFNSNPNPDMHNVHSTLNGIA